MFVLFTGGEINEFTWYVNSGFFVYLIFLEVILIFKFSFYGLKCIRVVNAVKLYVVYVGNVVLNLFVKFIIFKF